MQNETTVTIICLCYNHGRFVRQALDSVRKQSYEDIELIIVDDCSTDDSVFQIRQWIAENNFGICIENNTNLGNNKAFNKGLAIAQGRYIMDLAADDLLNTDCIGKLVNKFNLSEHSNTGVVYCNAELIDEEGDPTGSTFFKTDEYGKTILDIPSGNVYLSVVNSGNKICPVAMLVHRKVWEILGQYDESLSYEDLDFWIRSSRQFDYEYVDELLCRKRIVRNSLSTQYKKRFTKRSRSINHSTYQILKNTLLNYNRSVTEDQALKKRINYEISLALRSVDIPLLFRYLWIHLKLRNVSKTRSANNSL